jgi:hypothetical protein
MKAPDYVADFDSATGMLRAIAHALRDEEFPTLGVEDSALEHFAAVINKLPDALKEQVYIWSGAAEAAPAEKMGEVDAEEVASWMAGHYPERRYPAVMVGSSNGAGVNLAAALRVPWLPQTFLIPVRRGGVHPDEPLEDLEWAREPGRALLEANPDLTLHHMHDPNQDRLMVQQMTYFRVKRRTLGNAYERFLRERLEPGGTIVLVECERRWPVIRVADRHYFQPGAMGGISPEEYLHGSEAVADYLERYGSHRRTWDFGEPDDEQPEAEWGFVPELRDDAERFAREHGYTVRRVAFTEPEDLSPFVADLYRWWYARRGIHPVRLLVESFILVEPYWTLRGGLTPYWAKFSTRPSVEKLERYLEQTPPFEEAHVMLFPHGTEGAGFAPASRWREVIDRVGAGGLLGVDEEAYPRDFAGLKRYHEAVKELGARQPLPEEPLRLQEIDEFVAEAGGRYDVSWLGSAVGAPEGSRR